MGFGDVSGRGGGGAAAGCWFVGVLEWVKGCGRRSHWGSGSGSDLSPCSGSGGGGMEGERGETEGLRFWLDLRTSWCSWRGRV